MQRPTEVKVYKRGTIAVIEMNGGENRINNLFCDEMLKALNRVERWDDVKAVITTGNGKFYSNGLDLEYLSGAKESEEKGGFSSVGEAFGTLFKRIVTFPMVTIAAINGHCFAAGFLLSMAHDFRVMQSDRGFMCMNEIDIGLPVTFPIVEVIRFRVHPNLLRDILVMGKRFNSIEAEKCGLVDKTAPMGGALTAAIEFGIEITKKQTFKRNSMAQMKKDVYRHVLFDNILVHKL